MIVHLMALSSFQQQTKSHALKDHKPSLIHIIIIKKNQSRYRTLFDLSFIGILKKHDKSLTKRKYVKFRMEVKFLKSTT